jgi:hypothetical protein
MHLESLVAVSYEVQTKYAIYLQRKRSGWDVDQSPCGPIYCVADSRQKKGIRARARGRARGV